MPAPLSDDLRKRIVEAREDGLTIEETAARLSVGTATVKRTMRLYRKSGDVTSPVHFGRPAGSGLVRDEHLEVIRVLVDEDGSRRLHELAHAFEQRTGVAVSVATMGRALRRANITRKESAIEPPKPTEQT